MLKFIKKHQTLKSINSDIAQEFDRFDLFFRRVHGGSPDQLKKLKSIKTGWFASPFSVKLKLWLHQIGVWIKRYFGNLIDDDAERQQITVNGEIVRVSFPFKEQLFETLISWVIQRQGKQQWLSLKLTCISESDMPDICTSKSKKNVEKLENLQLSLTKRKIAENKIDMSNDFTCHTYKQITSIEYLRKKQDANLDFCNTFSVFNLTRSDDKL